MVDEIGQIIKQSAQIAESTVSHVFLGFCEVFSAPKLTQITTGLHRPALRNHKSATQQVHTWALFFLFPGGRLLLVYMAELRWFYMESVLSNYTF